MKMTVFERICTHFEINGRTYIWDKKYEWGKYSHTWIIERRQNIVNL